MRAGPATIRGTALMTIATDMPCARCWPATSPHVAGRGHDRYTRNPRKDHQRTLPIRARPASAGGRWGMPITASKGHCHDEHAK